MTLREFVEAADRSIEKQFLNIGRVLPMFHFVDADGDQAVMPAPPGSKDQSAAVVRKLFEMMGATRYVMINEGWILEVDADSAEGRRMKGYTGSLEHVAGRKEVMTYVAEDEKEPMLMGFRDILRPERGKARLGPLRLVQYDNAEGRMVGMLPAKGARQ